MTNSINQPWAISDKFIARYGETWANMDFEIESKISEKNFKSEPMECLIGHLVVCNQKIAMRYKDLIAYSKAVSTTSNTVYANKVNKHDAFAIDIKDRSFNLRKHEIGKLNQTLADALHCAMRGYELGLYL